MIKVGQHVTFHGHQGPMSAVITKVGKAGLVTLKVGLFRVGDVAPEKYTVKEAGS